MDDKRLEKAYLKHRTEFEKKKQEEGKKKKKTKHSVGKELSIEENNLTTLGPKTTSTT